MITEASSGQDRGRKHVGVCWYYHQEEEEEKAAGSGCSGENRAGETVFEELFTTTKNADFAKTR
jgi:hypothetical protein